MSSDLRRIPFGVVLLFAFGFLLLAGVGLTLPLIISLAIDAPVSWQGLLWMLLLAYLIFTLTLMLQRKQAAWMLGLGLASLSVPIAIVMYFWASLIGGLIGLAVAVALFWSLRGKAVRAWFSEP